MANTIHLRGCSCAKCMADDEFEFLTCGQINSSRFTIDEVKHGHDILSAMGPFDDTLRAAIRDEYGDDEYVSRQVGYLLDRGVPMLEPEGYEDANLPSTSARAAAIWANKQLNRSKEFNRSSEKACIYGHPWRANRKKTPSGGVYCLLCLRRYSLQRSRRVRGSLEDVAHRKTREAIRIGRLKRQPCEACGATTPTVHAHHDDYRKPLDVRWFCMRHHVQQHHNLFTKIAQIRRSMLAKARPT